MTYTAGASKSTGDLITAADWNQNTITNVDYVKVRLDYGYLWLTSGQNAVTNGAVSGVLETTSDKVNFRTMDFDSDTIQYTSWQALLPADYDGGTVTYQVYWEHGAGGTDFAVIFTLQGVAFADGETLDLTFGTGVDVTDTGGTASMLYVSPESTAVTLAGTPAAGELAVFRLSRKASDGGDTLSIPARVLGVKIKYGRA